MTLLIINKQILSGALLNEINNAYDQYKSAYLHETKWISLLNNQIEDYKMHQIVYKQQKQLIKQKYLPKNSTTKTTPTTTTNSMDEDINDLKNSFDPIAVCYYSSLPFIFILIYLFI